MISFFRWRKRLEGDLPKEIFIRWTHTLFKKLCLVHLFKERFPIYFSADLLCWSSKSCGVELKKSFIKAFGQKHLITLLPGLFLNYAWGNNTHIYDYLLHVRHLYVMLSYLIFTTQYTTYSSRGGNGESEEQLLA